MKTICGIISIVLFFQVHSSAQGLDFFLKEAYAHSPMLKAQLYNSQFSNENFQKESMFKKNPMLEFGYTNVPINQWPRLDKHPMSGISIGISQFIAFPWEDYYRKKVFYQKYLSSKESLDETKNLLTFQVTTTYHNILFLYTRKLILVENKTVLDSILRLSEALVATNRMASSQLLKIRADIAFIENKIIKLEGAIKIAQAAMENLCGNTLAWSFDPPGIKKWIDVSYKKTVADKYNFSKHPVYKKVYAMYQAKIAARKLENSKLFPGVNVGVEYRYRHEVPGKDMGDDFISFKASMPLPLFYASKERHSINAAQYKENELQETLRKIELDLKSKWDGENKNQEQLLKAFHNFNQRILPGYFAVYQAQMASLSTGTIQLIDVLDSYQKYLMASLERAELYKDLVISRQKLLYLLYNQTSAQTNVSSNIKKRGEKK